MHILDLVHFVAFLRSLRVTMLFAKPGMNDRAWMAEAFFCCRFSGGRGCAGEGKADGSGRGREGEGERVFMLSKDV